MSDKERSSDAVEKMIGNMTAEKQNVQDGQYAPLGFTPPPCNPVPINPAETINWNQSQFGTNYNLYPSDHHLGTSYNIPSMHHQFNHHHQYGYIPPPPQHQPQHFAINEYNKNMSAMNNIKYIYNPMENGAPSSDMFVPEEFNLLNSNLHAHPPNSASNGSNHLIQNLFDHWVPNTSGTYSPFGSVGGMFEALQQQQQQQEAINVPPNIVEEQQPATIEDNSSKQQSFAFNHNNRTANRKPRMVAEVKPMRPSYSDVLTKPVPTTTTKSAKNSNVNSNDTKNESKQTKKDNKKNLKQANLDKINKANTLSRSNTSSEIKDLPNANSTIPKLASDKADSKKSDRQHSQLNRKWASLDNINEANTTTTSAKVVQPDDRKRANKTGDEATKQKQNAKKMPPNKLNDANYENDANQNAGNRNNDSFNVSKNGGLSKKSKVSSSSSSASNSRQKVMGNDSFDRPLGSKRNQRVRKRDTSMFSGVVGTKVQQYLRSWWRIITAFLFWLIHLISDVCTLSLHISRDMAATFWIWLKTHWALFLDTTFEIIQRVRLLSWLYEKFKKSSNEKSTPTKETKSSFLHSGLQNNINMPTTGDEAMKRLLACKGKDPYSILGVTPTCTDDDIKKYYKRQAFLVHPDKNQQPGAEEAFKILVHAFDMIGVPEKRATYDKGVVESVQVEQAWSELNELLTQLQQKVEAAANTIRCSACGQRHKRIKIDRPSYAARNCSTCKIHHSARVGDIWAEARCFGFLWNYYACMEGGVYDITEWAGCQKESLKHLRPDSHQVQYRISSGKQNSSSGGGGGGHHQPRRHSGHRHTGAENAPDLENLLNTLYGQQSDGNQTGNTSGVRKREKKGKK